MTDNEKIVRAALDRMTGTMEGASYKITYDQVMLEENRATGITILYSTPHYRLKLLQLAYKAGEEKKFWEDVVKELVFGGIALRHDTILERAIENQKLKDDDSSNIANQPPAMVEDPIEEPLGGA